MLGFRKTKKIFLCIVLIAFIYVLYIHQMLPGKVMEISKVNTKYRAIFNGKGILDFIRFGESMGAQKVLSSVEQTHMLMANNFNTKSISTKTPTETSTLATTVNILKEYRSKYTTAISATTVRELDKTILAQETRHITRENKEVVNFATAVTPFAGKSSLNKLKKNHSLIAKKLELQAGNIQTKRLLKNTAASDISRRPSIHNDEALTDHNGKLNFHIWYDVCETFVESLREFILFPQVPSRRFEIDSFQTHEVGNNFGQRIFGFLQPPTSGSYIFGISSNSNSELWISSGSRATNLTRVAFLGSRNESKFAEPGNYFKFTSQTSNSINLQHGKRYFVEVLYKHGVGKSHVEVVWKKPGETNFQIISKEYILLFVNDSHVKENTASIDNYWEDDIASLQEARGFDPFYRLPFIEPADTVSILPSCHYEPSYYIREKLVRFQVGRPRTTRFFYIRIIL